MPPDSVTAEHPAAHDPARRRSTTSLWRLRGYLRPYVGTLVLMAGTATAGVFVALAIPLTIRAIIDGPITDGDRSGIWPLGLLALALGVLEALLILLRRWVQAHAVLGVETAIRRDLYAKLDQLPMAFHALWQSGQLLSRVTSDLSTIRRFSGFGMLFLVINVVQMVATVGLLVHLYWPLGLVVGIAVVPVVWLSRSFERRYVVVSRRVQDEQGDVASQVEEAALGFRVIRSFGRQQLAYDKFDAEAGRLYESSVRKVRLASRFWTFLEVIPNVALALVLLLGAVAVGNGALSPGTLVAFITLLLSLVWPVAALGVILSMMQEAMTASDRVVEIFDTVPSIVGGTRTLEQPRGHLRMEGVGFHFLAEHSPAEHSPAEHSPAEHSSGGQDGADEHRADAGPGTLHDVDLDVRPGETLAVVGATGSGKTTLTALVPRLLDATAGRVTIDGVDVCELTLPCLRRVVASAFEEPTLFSMSARENIALGRPDATEDEIREALDVAQATFVDDLPWGLDTRIGEQGMSLSGGQRQRLALARAVLARPFILVLDDTLSALDVHTEALVETALRAVLRDATGIVVAHRASTVLLADKVALLQDGTITAVGTHSELLATVPAYRELLSADAESEFDLTGAGARR